MRTPTSALVLASALLVGAAAPSSGAEPLKNCQGQLVSFAVRLFDGLCEVVSAFFGDYPPGRARCRGLRSHRLRILNHAARSPTRVERTSAAPSLGPALFLEASRPSRQGFTRGRFPLIAALDRHPVGC
jgi:hypothetical protein